MQYSASYYCTLFLLVSLSTAAVSYFVGFVRCLPYVVWTDAIPSNLKGKTLRELLKIENAVR